VPSGCTKQRKEGTKRKDPERKGTAEGGKKFIFIWLGWDLGESFRSYSGGSSRVREGEEGEKALGKGREVLRGSRRIAEEAL